mgnify:CR=1 FL=1
MAVAEATAAAEAEAALRAELGGVVAHELLAGVRREDEGGAVALDLVEVGLEAPEVEGLHQHREDLLVAAVDPAFVVETPHGRPPEEAHH